MNGGYTLSTTFKKLVAIIVFLGIIIYICVSYYPIYQKNKNNIPKIKEGEILVSEDKYNKKKYLRVNALNEFNKQNFPFDTTLVTSKYVVSKNIPSEFIFDDALILYYLSPENFKTEFLNLIRKKETESEIYTIYKPIKNYEKYIQEMQLIYKKPNSLSKISDLITYKVSLISGEEKEKIFDDIYSENKDVFEELKLEPYEKSYLQHRSEDNKWIFVGFIPLNEDIIYYDSDISNYNSIEELKNGDTNEYNYMLIKIIANLNENELLNFINNIK